MLKVLKEGDPLIPLKPPNDEDVGPAVLGTADVPHVEQQDPTPPTGYRPRRTNIDPTALVVERVPMPRAPQARGSAWEPVFKKMVPGDSLFIPDTSVSRCSYVRMIAKRLGYAVSTRREGSGVRLWMTGEVPATTDADADDGL